MKRKLTDGVITKGQLTRLGLPGVDIRAKKLVEVELWESHRQGFYCPAYLKRNKSKAIIVETRRLEREASALGNHRRWHAEKSNPRCDYCAGRLIDSASPLNSDPNPQPDRVPDRQPESTETETRTETETKPETRSRTETGSSTEAGASAKKSPSKPFRSEAEQLLRDWVEAETPHRQITQNSWPGKVAAIRGFLDTAGWPCEQLRPILMRCAVISTDAIQLEIGRSRRPPARDPNANRKTIDRVVSEMNREVSTVAELERGIA